MKIYKVTIKEEKSTILKIDSDEVKDIHGITEKTFEEYGYEKTDSDNVKIFSSIEVKNTEDIKDFEIILERKRVLIFDRNAVLWPSDALKAGMTYYEEYLKYSDYEKAEFETDCGFEPGSEYESKYHIPVAVKITMKFSYGPKQDVYSEDDALYKVREIYKEKIKSDKYETCNIYPSPENH